MAINASVEDGINARAPSSSARAGRWYLAREDVRRDQAQSAARDRSAAKKLARPHSPAFGK
jgi:hypothetical protein